MDRFVQRYQTSEEAIPTSWKTSPLPKAPPKRPVGRPVKRKADSTEDPAPKKTCTDARHYERELTAVDSQPTKRGAYKMFNVKQKRQVVDHARLHGIRAAARQYNIPKSTVSDWMKTNFDDEQRNRQGHLHKPGRPVSYSADIEEKLLSFVLEQRDYDLPVSVDDLSNMAKNLVTDPDFKASRCWADKFMRRHNLTLRAKTSMSQRLPDDLEAKIESFHSFVRKQRQEDDFDDRLIINMDETPMYFDMVPTKTIETTGAKTVKVRTTASDKRHLTVVLACAASGDMLPPMVIFKGKRELSLTTPDGWVVCVQEKGWMDEALMLRWIKEIYVPFTTKDRSLLVLDSFRAHLTDSVKKTLRKNNTVPAVIPGGCTSKLQPLDVSINKPFKGELRKSWSAFMRSAVKTSLDKKEKIKAASKEQIVEWIDSAFKYISNNRTMVMKSFLICGISNSLSGDENSLVRNDDIIDHESIRSFLDSDDDDEEFEGFDPVDLID